MSAPLQPLLHNEIVVLRAPTQAWSAKDGSIGSSPIHGLFFSDVRVVSELTAIVGGAPGEHIATEPLSADSMSFVTLLRHLDDKAADPKVRSIHTRTASAFRRPWDSAVWRQDRNQPTKPAELMRAVTS
jgi:hypothetical protein